MKNKKKADTDDNCPKKLHGPEIANTLLVLLIPVLLISHPLNAADMAKSGSENNTAEMLPKIEKKDRKLNYDDLLLSMEENNMELKKLEEEVVQAQLDVKDAKAGYQPTIDLTLGMKYDAFPMKFTIDTSELMPPISMLPPGGEKEFQLSPDLGYSLQLDLQQPVFTWGKITNSVKLYKEVADVKNLQFESKKTQLEAALKGNLAAVYYLQKIEKLLEVQDEYVKELVVLSEDGKRQGVLLQQDVLEAKMQASLIPVTIAEIKSNKADVLQDIRTLTGLPELKEEDFIVIPDEEYFEVLGSKDIEVLEQMALDPNQDTLVMLDKLAAVTNYAKKIAKGSIYGKPDIAVQGSVGFMGDMEKLFEGDAKFDDNFKANVSIGLKTTLWDGGKKLNDIKRSESKIETAVIDRENAETSIKQELNKQYNALNIAKLRIEYEKLKIETAQSDVAKAEELSRSGYGSKTDVLQAKITKATEEINLLQEKLKLATAAYTIEALIN